MDQERQMITLNLGPKGMESGMLMGHGSSYLVIFLIANWVKQTFEKQTFEKQTFEKHTFEKQTFEKQTLK
jgi:hypothetical protein